MRRVLVAIFVLLIKGKVVVSVNEPPISRVTL